MITTTPIRERYRSYKFLGIVCMLWIVEPRLAASTIQEGEKECWEKTMVGKEKSSAAILVGRAF